MSTRSADARDKRESRLLQSAQGHEVEYGYFRKPIGAHLGEPNIVLLECGHEVQEWEPVGAWPRLCTGCREPVITHTISEEEWMAWAESKDALDD